ncbi:MAG TPA: serine hydrolase domain-containing protein [Candidatus Dormibacteraeota bacterium]|nr:serine hydrolase domain-containing protein [Candidatus Dormibacteraeota bacterium]
MLQTVDRVLDVAREFVERGWDRGIAVAVLRDGACVVDAVTGTDLDGCPLDTGTRFLWFSASKPLTAFCVVMLADRGLLGYDDPLVRWIPEIGGGERARITVDHLLTHRAGIPDFFCTGVTVEDWYDWDRAVRLTAALPLEYAPGSQTAYHALSFGLLGELVRRVDGRPFARFFAEEVARPLGLDTVTWGLPDRSVPYTRTGVEGQAEAANVHRFQTGAALDAVVPAGNAWGTARDLARFHQMLGDGGEGLVSPHSAAEMVRARVDGHQGMLGRGVEVGRRPGGCTGDLAGPRVFGHPGIRSTVGWHDPDTGVSCAILCNGTPGPEEGERRLSAISDAVITATRA